MRIIKEAENGEITYAYKESAERDFHIDKMLHNGYYVTEFNFYLDPLYENKKIPYATFKKHELKK